MPFSVDCVLELPAALRQCLAISTRQQLEQCAGHLDTLDRIDPQIGFEVLVEPEHVARVAGFFRDYAQQCVQELLARQPRAVRRSSQRGSGRRRWLAPRGCRDRLPAALPQAQVQLAPPPQRGPLHAAWRSAR